MGRSIQWSKYSPFNKWCWEVCTATCKKNETHSPTDNIYKNIFKEIKDLNINRETINVLVIIITIVLLWVFLKHCVYGTTANNFWGVLDNIYIIKNALFMVFFLRQGGTGLGIFFGQWNWESEKDGQTNWERSLQPDTKATRVKRPGCLAMNKTCAGTWFQDGLSTWHTAGHVI